MALNLVKKSLIETISDTNGKVLAEFEHIKNGNHDPKAYFPLVLSVPASMHGGILKWYLTGVTPHLSDFVERLKKILIKEFFNIHFISPDRGIFERYQAVQELKQLNAGVGVRGENTISVIQHLRNNDVSRFKEILYEADKFGIKIETRIDGPNTSVIFNNRNLPINVNIVDAGFGLNQILPIIVQSYIAEKGGTILIEEPEMHLHEGAQYLLLDMFLDIIQKGKQLVITSHSVALRSKVIREREEDPRIQNIQFYNIELERDGSTIKPEPLDRMDIREGRQYMSQEDYNRPST